MSPTTYNFVLLGVAFLFVAASGAEIKKSSPTAAKTVSPTHSPHQKPSKDLETDSSIGLGYGLYGNGGGYGLYGNGVGYGLYAGGHGYYGGPGGYGAQVGYGPLAGYGGIGHGALGGYRLIRYPYGLLGTGYTRGYLVPLYALRGHGYFGQGHGSPSPYYGYLGGHRRLPWYSYYG